MVFKSSSLSLVAAVAMNWGHSTWFGITRMLAGNDTHCLAGFPRILAVALTSGRPSGQSAQPFLVVV